MNGKQAFAQRNASIDHLRALTMLTMIFVNDFWKIHGVPRWLEHAAWGEDFMGLADVVFPCFLFAVGMSIPYAIERRYAKGFSVESTFWHILSRTFALLVMGAFVTNSEFRLSPEAPYPIGVYWFLMAIGFVGVWNQYPHPSTRKQQLWPLVGKLIGWAALLYLAFTFRNPKGGVFGAHWGILGSIGWTYLVCATVYFFCRDRLERLAAVWLVFVLICLVNTPLRESYGSEPLFNFPERNFWQGMLGVLHIGNGALPAFTMGGIVLSVASVRCQEKRPTWRLGVALMVAAGFIALGTVTHQFWIVAKIGATPPWLFYVTGIATAIYGLLRWLEGRGWTGWLVWIRPAGTATLTVYLLPYIYYGMADVTGVVLPDWATHGPMGLLNCFCFALLVIATAGVLERLHVKLKI